VSALAFTATKTDISCDSGSCSGHRNARYRMTIAGYPAGAICSKCKGKYERIWKGAHD
jgi:hypothetical protein